MKLHGASRFSRNILLMLILFLALAIPAGSSEPGPGTNKATSIDKLAGFSDGLAAVGSGGKWGFIDAKGQVAIKFIFREVGSFNADLAPARVDKQKWGYINKKGLFVINPRFDDARPFSEGLAPVRKGNLWGYIDTKGRLIHDYAYEDLKGFYYGLAPAKRTGKWGYIDTKGRFALKRQWLEAGEFREGLAPVKDLENQWGYIDTKGNIYIEAQFDDAKEFSERMAAVKVESKWGFINYKGRYRINPQYEEVMRYSEGYAAAKKDGKWGYIDRFGNNDIPFIYDEASDFSDYLALVTKDGAAYYIDDEGEKALDITTAESLEPGKKWCTCKSCKPGRSEAEMKAAALAPVLPSPALSSVKPAALDFEIKYVSAANSMGTSGAKHKDDAVYLIRIKGAGLDRDKMFKEGLNGFRYEIDLSDGSGKYRVSAYPLNGVKYSDDGIAAAALDPGETAFYWIGPKSDGSKYLIKLTQYVRDFNNGSDKILGTPAIKALPKSIPAPGNLSYRVTFYKSQGESYFNGVCAYPLGIRLTDNSGFDAPAEVYDRLVFYGIDETGGIRQEKVIGADPADVNMMAIIPAKWGSGVTMPRPKYGFSNLYPQAAEQKMRTFYVYAMPTTNPERFISVQLLDEKGSQVKANNFSLSRITSEIKTSFTGEPNMDKLMTLSLTDPNTQDLSDPSKGAFDFVFEKTGGENNYYILPLLPEGLNERSISARFNFSTFKRGFYMIPVYAGDKVTSFNVSGNTSSLISTCGKDIYACAFDIHGRFDRSQLFRDDAKMYVRNPNNQDAYDSLQVKWINTDCVNVPDAAAAKKSTMGNRFMMGLDNKTPLPVIYSIEGTVMDNKDKYKMRNYSKTSIIVAPYSESFYATGDDQLFYVETSAFWEMSGRSLVSDVNRFHNRFSAKKTTSGNAGLVKIKSERDFKNSDRDRPYGSDGKFFFFYNHKDARATNWTVRYKPWNEVEAGCGYYGGAWRDNHMDGGDFNGTMHDDWFNPNQW